MRLDAAPQDAPVVPAGFHHHRKISQLRAPPAAKNTNTPAGPGDRRAYFGLDVKVRIMGARVCYAIRVPQNALGEGGTAMKNKLPGTLVEVAAMLACGVFVAGIFNALAWAALP